jgi:hemolysin III
MNRPAESSLELPVWQRSAADELINASTHAIGLMLALTGALVMSGDILGTGNVPAIIGCVIYLASLMAVYAMSTMSHLAWTPSWKQLFRRLDQGTIFMLIAATYTPFSLSYLQDTWWSWLLAVMWIVALLGFVSKVFFAHRVEMVSTVPYVALGWMPVIAAPAILQVMPMQVFSWMLLGGVCYTLGTLFLIYDQRIRHFHAVWHLFVIAGSACHFYGIILALGNSHA